MGDVVSMDDYRNREEGEPQPPENPFDSLREKIEKARQSLGVTDSHPS